jgi:hypothetical protein
MYSFRNLLHPSKSFEPVEKMLLQEAVYLAVIAELSAALLNMLDPVKTSVLDLRRKTSLNLASFDLSHKHTGSIYATDVLLE